MKGIPHEEVIAELLTEDADLAADCLAQALDGDESPGVVAIAFDDLARAGYAVVVSAPACAAPAPAGLLPPGSGTAAEGTGDAAESFARVLEGGTSAQLADAVRALVRAGYTFSLSGPDPAVKRAILARSAALTAGAPAPAPLAPTTAAARPRVKLRSAPAAKKRAVPAKRAPAKRSRPAPAALARRTRRALRAAAL